MIDLSRSHQLGRYYSLLDHFGEDKERRYRGCGNGFIVVSKATGEVVEMSYADDGVTICREPNFVTCWDAGSVLSENVEQVVYRVNFSMRKALLF